MNVKALVKRGITQETCRKFGYYIAHTKYGTSQIANYICDGEVVFQKSRSKDKKFYITGKAQPLFYGQHLFNGGKKLVITEGEIDCLSVSQVQSNKYPVVSLPFGCKSAVEAFKHNYEWLCSFDEVIVMFDMDEVGQAAVKAVSGILPPHKLKVAKLPLKDANECLQKGKADAIINAIWRAQEYKPEGIVNANDLKETLYNDIEDSLSYDYPWCKSLNAMTAGIRKGEITLLTAGSGVGKSTMARAIAYKLRMSDNLKIGMMMLEEKTTKTARDLLSLHVAKPLQLIWQSKEAREATVPAFTELFGSNQFVLYDHFGSLEADSLLDNMRYMAVVAECDFIILDHITIAVSGLATDSGDVKALDILMTRLRSLVAETGVGMIIVSHLRKVGNGMISYEEGGVTSLDALRGSGALKQLSDTILGFERNQQAEEEEDRDFIRIRVLKNRFTGETGLTKGGLKYIRDTCSLIEASPPVAEGKEEECSF